MKLRTCGLSSDEFVNAAEKRAEYVNLNVSLQERSF